MKNKEFTTHLIQTHEGLSLKPYRCTAGKLTIGVGRNLEDRGITTDEALYLLDNDIHECALDVQSIFTHRVYESMPFRVQSALIDMRFQLGYGGFRAFKRMIAAIKVANYRQAAIEMRDSRWYAQTPNRAEELAQIVEFHAPGVTGEPGILDHKRS